MLSKRKLPELMKDIHKNFSVSGCLASLVVRTKRGRFRKEAQKLRYPDMLRVHNLVLLKVTRGEKYGINMLKILSRAHGIERGVQMERKKKKKGGEGRFPSHTQLTDTFTTKEQKFLREKTPTASQRQLSFFPVQFFMQCSFLASS